VLCCSGSKCLFLDGLASQEWCESCVLLWVALRCSVLQCVAGVALCCSVLCCIRLQWVAVSISRRLYHQGMSQVRCVAVCAAVSSSVLQCAAVCCSVLQCAAVRYVAVGCSVSLSTATSPTYVVSYVCCSALQRVAACCSVLQHLEVCCVAVGCQVSSHVANFNL